MCASTSTNQNQLWYFLSINHYQASVAIGCWQNWISSSCQHDHVGKAPFIDWRMCSMSTCPTFPMSPKWVSKGSNICTGRTNQTVQNWSDFSPKVTCGLCQLWTRCISDMITFISTMYLPKRDGSWWVSMGKLSNLWVTSLTSSHLEAKRTAMIYWPGHLRLLKSSAVGRRFFFEWDTGMCSFCENVAV